jgi:Tol biopolymer transport system component
VRVRALTTGTLEHRAPSLSPDGQTVAFVAGTGGKTNVFTIGLSGGNARQLTFLDSACSSPAWSPDGKRIAFVSNHQGTARIWVVDAFEGSPLAYEKTTPTGGGPVYWSPGSRILYRMQSGRNHSAFDPATGDEESIISDLPEGWMINARLAPDGNRVAFRWNRKPHRQLWLAERQQGARRLLLDTGSAVPIGWSADSIRIYVVDDSGGTTRVFTVSPDSGSKEPLFEVPFKGGEDASVSLDGKKFVFTRIDRSGDVWFAENFDEDVSSSRDPS